MLLIKYFLFLQFYGFEIILNLQMQLFEKKN